MMWADEPYRVTSLSAVEVEPPVEPTTFASAVHAWDTLPEPLRGRVEGLSALHVNDAGVQRGDDGDLLHITYERPQTTTTPVGHRHPGTGRRMLYVSQMMTQGIVDLPAEESEALLGELFDHLYRPSNLWQHHWAVGDLVVWDNLAVQHARPDVRVDGPVRTLRKVSSATASKGSAGRARFGGDRDDRRPPATGGRATSCPRRPSPRWPFGGGPRTCSARWPTHRSTSVPGRATSRMSWRWVWRCGIGRS